MLDEAQYLLDNADVIPDPDERLRRDLRHLGSYAVDREGATEVGDSLIQNPDVLPSFPSFLFPFLLSLLHYIIHSPLLS